MGKKKVVSEIEDLFRKTGENELHFQNIVANIDEKRSTLLGLLSSHPRIFNKVRKNVWSLIPDGLTTIEKICEEYEVDREVIQDCIDDNGSISYAWIRVEKQEGGFSKREVHYLLHTMRKHGAIKTS
tara:strand:- start:51 stop:431 length:381 start_codon:yes stop_codon:yes gene_type:complete